MAVTYDFAAIRRELGFISHLQVADRSCSAQSRFDAAQINTTNFLDGGAMRTCSAESRKILDAEVPKDGCVFTYDNGSGRGACPRPIFQSNEFTSWELSNGH